MTIRIAANADPETVLLQREQVEHLAVAMEKKRLDSLVWGLNQQAILACYFGYGPDDRVYSVQELSKACRVPEAVIQMQLDSAIVAIRGFIALRER